MQTRTSSRGGAELAPAALLVLAAVLIGLPGCKEKTDLYCCSTAGSCQRSGGGDEPVRCTDPARPFCDDDGAFPASGGIRNTCIPDPGDPPECEEAAECTDPARPLCEEGRCVACAGPEDCDAAAPVCDETAGECVGCSEADDCAGFEGTPVCAADGACVGCEGPADCAAATPVCDEGARACRACAADADCGTGACDLLEGTCAEESAVLFVTPDGAGTQCTRNLPCDTLAEAAAVATPDRALVRIAAGTYTGTTALAGVRLRVFADPGTILRPTPGGSVTIDVTGASDVLLHGVEITGIAGGDSFANLRCRVGDGSPALRLVESSVKEAPGLGIEASSCALTVERSVVSGNTGGGISTSGGRFTLINNFVVQNGSSSAAIGGASLNGTAESRFEHNTVTRNDVLDEVAGGLNCVGPALVLRNNLIFSNQDDDTKNGNVQVSGNCSHRFSLIGPEPEEGEGNQSEAPTFVDPSAGDFHLAPTSSGVDQGEPSSVTDDVDGDPRPQGAGPDIGADEVPPR